MFKDLYLSLCVCVCVCMYRLFILAFQSLQFISIPCSINHLCTSSSSQSVVGHLKQNADITLILHSRPAEVLLYFCPEVHVSTVTCGKLNTYLQKAHFMSITNITGLIMFSEVMAVYSESHTKHIHTCIHCMVKVRVFSAIQ